MVVPGDQPSNHRLQVRRERGPVIGRPEPDHGVNRQRRHRVVAVALATIAPTSDTLRALTAIRYAADN